MAHHPQCFPIRRRRCLALVAMLASLLACAAAAATTVAADNGLRIRLHTSEDLAGEIREDDGRLVLRDPAVGEVELLRGPRDPRFPRRDVDEFVPLPADAVTRALTNVRARDLDVDVDVFLLPAPPAGVMTSFARRGAILLSPSFGPVSESTVAMMTVHELGHVLTWVYLDRRSELWDRYMALRGLDPVRNGPAAPHAQRAREILAEDVRVLFGGDLAAADGAIENQALAAPAAVDGLSEFLHDTLRGDPARTLVPFSAAAPNPCNPLTTISLDLPAATSGDPATALLTVVDLRGRIVRTVHGGLVGNGRLQIVWQGDDDEGRRAASGTYVYFVSWEGIQGRGTVTVAR